MIVDSDHNNPIMKKQAPVVEEPSQEGPPSYDDATENGPCTSSQGDVGKQKPDDSSVQQMLIPHPLPGPAIQPSSTPSPIAYNYINAMSPQPSHTTQPLSTPSPMVYNYVNAMTGERIVSLLPPNHPEMICLQSGSHVPHTRFGLLGLLAAVFWFPFGIGLCLLDRRVRCQRCGFIIEDGVCS